MTPEQERWARDITQEDLWYDKPMKANLAKAARLALDELDRLRSSVDLLHIGITDRINSATYLSFDKSEYASILRLGRDLGLWD